MRSLVKSLVITVLTGSVLLGAGKSPTTLTQHELDAIRWKESSGLAEPKDGDGGKAIGPFQIWRVYWEDAVAYDATLNDEPHECYNLCRDKQYAERVVRAYIRRWATARNGYTGTFREVAMLHNGGAGILRKPKDSKAYRNAASYADVVVRNLASLKQGEKPANK
jgi:hypothetical protein